MADQNLNLKQIYDANPSTTVANKDLIYLDKFPYNVGDDSAIEYEDLLAQIISELPTDLFTPAFVYYVAKTETPVIDPDGSLQKPFPDPFAAMAAISGQTWQQSALIVIQSPGTYASATTFSIKPNVSIAADCMATVILECDFDLDPSWASIAIAGFSNFSDIILDGTIDFDFTNAATLGLGMLFNGCYIAGEASFVGVDDKIPQISIYNTRGDDWYFESTNLRLIGGQTDGNVEIHGSAAGGANATNRIYNNRITGNLLLSGANTSTQTLDLIDSQVSGTLTLDTVYTVLNATPASIPRAGITLSNGALISQVTPRGNTPLLLSNNAYTGQNYVTPVAITSSSNLTAWNLNTAPNAKQTMTQNTTLSNPTNQIEGMYYTSTFIQGSGPYTLAFDSAYDDDDVTPIISQIPGSENILIWRSNGTTMRLVGTVIGG